MGTGHRIREKNVFVFFAVPSSASVLQRALCPGERAGRLGAGRAGKMRCGLSTGMAEQLEPCKCLRESSAERQESTWYLRGYNGISLGFQEFSILHLLLFCLPLLSVGGRWY